MAEELLEFENTVEDPDGKGYVAHVMGAGREDEKWVGWLEFRPVGGGAALTTDRETTQPNRDDLAYWSTGLTYFYLEGALARARRRQERGESGGQLGSPRRGSEAPAARVPSSGVPRLEVRSADPRLAEHVMEVVEPRPGTSREIPDAGIVVYEGMRDGDAGGAHVFAIQYGSPTAGATLSNWLWSRLHGEGVEVRVNGTAVQLTSDGLHDALIPPAP